MKRRFLSFRAVNREHQPGYDPGLQRHHLLPRQLLATSGFEKMFSEICDRRTLFEDFRENGLLLPCREAAALRLGLPLHRGPHRQYSELVAVRVGQIEADWARIRVANPEAAMNQAQMRLALLQRALRRFLLEPRRRRPVLNRRDPVLRDYSELDQVVEALWGATPPVPLYPQEEALAPGTQMGGFVAQSMPSRPRRRVAQD